MELNDQPIPLQRRRWLYLSAAVVLVSIPILIIVDLTASEVKRSILGQPPPPGSEWYWMLTVWAMTLTMIVVFVREARLTLKLYFSERGVHEGKRFIAWQDATGIQLATPWITIRSTHTKIIINLWTFKDPQEVCALVRSRAPLA